MLTILQQIDPQRRLHTTEEQQQRFMAAAEQSRKHFSTTGLHIRHEEFSQWVDALQANPQAHPPETHA